MEVAIALFFPDNSRSFSWFSLRVKHHHEKTASQFLSDKGYSAFPAVHRRISRWSDRSKTLETPLFPTYIFCRLDKRLPLPVLTTPGVLYIVGTRRDPIAIPDSQVEAVQAVISSGLPVLPWPYISAGRRIVVERGALAGLEGYLLEVKNALRVVVSVSLFQRSITAEVDRDSIRHLPHDSSADGRVGTMA